jgi:hypothetical protein
MKAITRTTLLIAACWGLMPAAPAAAQPLPQDVVTVATVSSAGPVIDVPVYIRDVANTPLGIDQPFGSRIQSYSIKVDYAPTVPVQSVTFTRAGITQPLTPTFEASPAAAGSISLLDNFNETTNLIPFVSNAPVPGNQIGHLTVTLAPGVAPGTVITLTLDPLLTQLTDAGGDALTAETTTNGRLALVNGTITVLAAVPGAPTLGGWALLLLIVSLGVIAVRLRM